VALSAGGSRGIGAVTIKRLAGDGADVASVFVTNGGYNGVQQVLRLSTPPSLEPRQTKTATNDSEILADRGQAQRRRAALRKFYWGTAPPG
jgi:NAD(P)-dependent dehydrogenase (short-subunit alcohol dehydrogenase family)